MALLRTFEMTIALAATLLPLAAAWLVAALGRHGAAVRARRVAAGAIGAFVAAAATTIVATVDPFVRGRLVHDGVLVWGVRFGAAAALAALAWRVRGEVRASRAAVRPHDGAGTPYRSAPRETSGAPRTSMGRRIASAIGAAAAVAVVSVVPVAAGDLGAIGPSSMRSDAAVAVAAVEPGLAGGEARRELRSRPVSLATALGGALARCGDRTRGEGSICVPARLDAALAEISTERSPDARGLLRGWLDRPGADPRVRARAALELVRLGDTSSAYALVTIASRNAALPWARADALELVALVGDSRSDDAVPVAEGLLHGFGPQSDVSSAALDLLVDLASRESLEAACDLVNDPAWDEALGARLGTDASRLRRWSPAGRRAACSAALDARRGTRWL